MNGLLQKASSLSGMVFINYVLLRTALIAQGNHIDSFSIISDVCTVAENRLDAIQQSSIKRYNNEECIKRYNILSLEKCNCIAPYQILISEIFISAWSNQNQCRMCFYHNCIGPKPIAQVLKNILLKKKNNQKPKQETFNIIWILTALH